MANRFDLEQEIMKCWGVVDDIDMLFETSCERRMSEDELANVLLGMKTLYQMKFEKLFSTFEQLIAKGHFKESPNDTEEE